MTDFGQRSDTKFEIEDELDYLFANASPNPSREGCPSRETLTALSRREKPIGDPDYLHLVRCSPCFREFRAIQQAKRAKTRAARAWAAAAAAVIVLAAAGAWILRPFRSTTPTLPQLSSSEAAADLTSTLDLRLYTVTRGDDLRRDVQPLFLPAGRVNTTLLLPVGSEPGTYDLRILDRDSQMRAAATGAAAIRNHITTLQLTIDSSRLSAGDYQLAVRRNNDDWQTFPLRIR
jgi:hypothetical protein